MVVSAQRILAVVLCLRAVMSQAAQEPIARWDFEDGPGETVRDTSGNGFDGQAINLTWIKVGRGLAVQLNGRNAYVDCGTTVAERIKDTVTLEAWVHPQNTPGGEVGIAGTGFDGFLLTHYRDGGGWWYVASGSNHVRTSLESGTWQHLVATLDGDVLALIVNGREAARAKSSLPVAGPGRSMLIGSLAASVGSPATQGEIVGCFLGMVDAVRLYDRALTVEEAARHFKSEAGDYGFDTQWFRRVRTRLFHYPQRQEAVVDLDYRGLMPLPDSTTFDVQLTVAGAPAQRVVLNADSSGLSEARLSLRATTSPCDCQIIVTAIPEVICPIETLQLTHPVGRERLASPQTHIVPALPAASAPADFEVELLTNGGFRLHVAGEKYDVSSRFSWPRGDFNSFATTDNSAGQETGWAPAVHQETEGTYVVEAHGAHYRVVRSLVVTSDHVDVSDTIINLSQEDLGLFMFHEIDTQGKSFDSHYVCGFPGLGRRTESPSPSVFVGRPGLGIGLLPVDDLFVIQSQMEVSSDRVSAGTEQFALPPGKSYTFQWSVYLNTSGDYYDFINAFRHCEGRIGAVDGGAAFITKGPFDRRNVPDEAWMNMRNIKYGIIHCLSGTADDPALSIEGIEFVDFPQERALLQQHLAELRRRYPHHVFMFHIAHSLYLTDNPDRFADSTVVGPDLKPCVWGDSGRYISLERQSQGWQWYIFYPAPGNSLHDAMLASVDVMMDDLGAQGAFLDGFFWGYVSRWTYNTWDGLSADLDPVTKTIARKKASVLYLSQPSLIQYARKIRDKGGVVIANNSVITRSIANEKYLIHDKEISAGPDLHLAPNATALTDSTKITRERDVYRDMLAKLRCGMLFLYYQEGALTYPSLAAKQFPITFEQIREGVVIGPERVVTMKSGVYGRRGDRSVPAVHHFDARGGASGRVFLTTVDHHGARTELDLATDESAVLENIGLTIESTHEVNAAVLEYTPTRLCIALNGLGSAMLHLAPITSVAGGAMPILEGAAYTVTVDGIPEKYTASAASLRIELLLSGEHEIVVAYDSF